eukprot:Hpha_TRINITY_DN9641_c0_g1::TRINITY_DN9641_c0_g1_i2::g.184572::m.184572/K01485/codA; cytosine deaminase
MGKAVTGVTGARLVGRDGLWDIRFEDGHIAGVVPAGEGSWDVEGAEAAEGSVVVGGFVEPHLHPDKAFLLDRCPPRTGSFEEALCCTFEAKKAFDEADVYSRAKRALEQAVAHGTAYVRAHVEVDTAAGMVGVGALSRLKREFNGVLEVELVAFAQECITSGKAPVGMLREALRRGCTVIGSAPYCDAEPEENISVVFDLAQEFECGVDFHLDYHLGGDKPSLLDTVLRETTSRGWQHRVCLGHMTRLSSLPPAELESVLGLPASDIYMMGRGDDHDKRRGIAPLDTMAAHGVCVGFGSNNVQNLFTLTGDCDPLRSGTLCCQLLQLGTPHQHRRVLEMCSEAAAVAVGIKDHPGLVPSVGRRAHLVILRGTPDATHAVVTPPSDRTVIHDGRVVAETRREVKFY